jgi:hypothetical protein
MLVGMQRRILALFLSFSLPVLAQPASPQDFLAAVKKALADRSTEEFMILTYTNGQTPDQIQDDPDLYLPDCNDHVNKVTDVTLGALPDSYRGEFVGMGWHYQLAHPADGAVLLHKVGSDGTPFDEPEPFPYASIGGKYYLIPQSGTNLHWKGPEDHSLGAFSLEGSYSQTVITIEWNASGVDQKWTVHSANAQVSGQYIEKVTATNLDDERRVRLAIFDQEKMIYRSDWLKGRGTLTYTKGM